MTKIFRSFSYFFQVTVVCGTYKYSKIINYGRLQKNIYLTERYQCIPQMRLSVGGENPEYPVKTTDLSQVTDKLYHIMFYGVPLDMS